MRIDGRDTSLDRPRQIRLIKSSTNRNFECDKFVLHMQHKLVQPGLGVDARKIISRNFTTLFPFRAEAGDFAPNPPAYHAERPPPDAAPEPGPFRSARRCFAMISP